jgi:RimJ/RimL family protein N-acetyltransferase
MFAVAIMCYTLPLFATADNHPESRLDTQRANQPASDVHLRDVVEDDLPIFFEHQRDPEATRMAAFPARERDAFMAHWKNKVLGDAANAKQTILVDGEVAGNILCFGPPEEREVGYWIGREYWGRGIATRALEAFLQQIPERPLHAYVAKGNGGSLRVLQKCGFAVTGEDEEGFTLYLP